MTANVASANPAEIAVWRPETAAALREAVATALDAGERLEILGGGTKRTIGRPVEAKTALDLSGLRGITSYEPGELVLTACAGTTLAEIEAALDEKHQHLAFEPPDLRRLLGVEGEATLGGTVAANLAGPRRVSAGAARDHFLGFSAVSGRAEIFKAGGRVVKNVTGYDLPKLIAGSWGTLAALAELTVKVMPRPELAVTLALEGLDAARAVAAMAAALQAPCEVSGAAWLPDGTTLLRLEGFGPAVAERFQTLARRLREFGQPVRLDPESGASAWRRIRDVETLALCAPGDIVWKISCPPAEGARVLAAFPDGHGFLDWGGGLVWLALPASEPDAGAARVRAALGASGGASGGHATLIRAPEAVRRRVAVFEPLPPALAGLARRVKESFDPRDLLNPGRLYPRET